MRWGFEDGDSYKEHSINDLLDKEKNYKIQFTTKFPKFEHLVKEPFNVISMVHYS